MNPKHLPHLNSPGGSAVGLALVPEELPLKVREAAVYLGVSVQTVYLWVERKQIPHLRVMGRNIRFLKSELEPFRATFKQEVVNWQDRVKHDGGLVQARGIGKSGGCGTETRTVSASGNRLSPKTGRKRKKLSESACRPETTTRCPRCAADRRASTFGGLVGLLSGELLQAAIPRAEDPRSESARAEAPEEAFESTKLAELTADDIEMYLRKRLKQRVAGEDERADS